MRRYLAPFVLLLLGAVAPATSDSTQRGLRSAGADAEQALLIYRSRPGDTLRGITERWLLPIADLRRLQLLNGLSGDTGIPEGTEIRIPEQWVRTQAVEAVVAAFRGQVRVARGGALRPAEKGMRLLEGDEIETGPNSFATLSLPDASRVSLPSASRVAVERLRQVPLTDSLDRRFTLVQGRSDMKVTPMANPASRFLITTPVAVAAVRGTEYRVSFTPAEMRSVTEVTEGRVAVRLADGSAEVLVEAGFAAIATPDGLRGPLALPARPLVALRSRAQTESEVTFRLRPMPGIAGYLVEIAADAGFVDRVASAEAEAAVLVFRDLPNGHYHARAYLISDEGVRGIPAVFEFERQYAPAAEEIAEAPVPVPWLEVPALFAMAGDSWGFSGGGGAGAGGDSTGPVVVAAAAALLAESTEDAGAGRGEGEGEGASSAQPFARLLPLAASLGGDPAFSGGNGGFAGGGGFPGGGGGGLFPVLPDPVTDSGSGTDSGQAGGPQIPGEIPGVGVPAAIPEPRVWLLLLTGFGLVGWTVRSRRRLLA